MKYFRMSYEEVVFNRSYVNIILLNRSIPSFNIDKEGEKDAKNTSKATKKEKDKKTFSNEDELFMSLM